MRREHVPILVLIIAAAFGLTWMAPGAWLVLLTDGLLATAILGAAAGWGAWPIAWLGFKDRSLGRQVCLATTLGLGVLAICTLLFGIAGVLSRPLAWTLVAIGGALGLARLYLAQADRRHTTGARAGAGPGVAAGSGAPPFQGGGLTRSLMLLPLAVPLVVALFGATLPPGMLWQGEANGYDVLEYHLQAPREYYETGRITFLPHNVYASFPQQMEMLYLLLMHLAGGTYLAAIPAQLLHAGCGILAVVALGCWARPGWPRALVVLLAGSTPWLAYVGCLAYTENGMLLFAAVAAGLVVEPDREQTSNAWRATLTAGICAGLACGCKYTAIVFVPGSLAIAWLITMRASLELRVQRVAAFGIGATVAFSPWLVRNVAFTHNPVYPFAHEWFDGRAWSAEQAQQWSTAHHVPIEHSSLTGRLTLAARELFGTIESRQAVSQPGLSRAITEGHFRPSLFGLVLIPLALVGLAVTRSRQAAALALWSGLIFVSWITFTFIPGRFALPLIVPTALLAGGAVAYRPRTADKRIAERLPPPTRWQWPVLALALLGALINDVSLVGRLREHDRRWTARTEVPMRMLSGQTGIFVSDHPLNRALPEQSHTWLVGAAAAFYVDRKVHYTVPFSRDPWLEYAVAASARQALDWLRDRQVTHLVFCWSEIDRLRRTYGFSDVATPGWAARLEEAGLRPVDIGIEPGGAAGFAVYEITWETTP